MILEGGGFGPAFKEVVVDTFLKKPFWNSAVFDCLSACLSTFSQ